MSTLPLTETTISSPTDLAVAESSVSELSLPLCASAPGNAAKIPMSASTAAG